MPNSSLNLILYVASILLATLAFWEIFPERFSKAQKFSLAGSLLALFLTFLSTTSAVENLNSSNAILVEKVDRLSTTIGKVISIKHLSEFIDSDNMTKRAVFDVWGEYSNDLEKLLRNGVVDLDESIALAIIAKAVSSTYQKAINSDIERAGLKIHAVSTDPAEFDRANDSTDANYEVPIGDVARDLKTGGVTRIYLLDKDRWESIQRDSDVNIAFRGALPWTIPAHLDRLGLENISRHYCQGIDINFASIESLSGRDKRNYDFFILYENEKVILAANRISIGRIRLCIGESDVSKAIEDNWRTASGFATIKLPPYRAKPSEQNATRGPERTW